MFDYVFIRKKRKTVGIRLDRYGNITVSAPLRYTKPQADRFVLDHADWIIKKRAELAACNPLPKLTFREGEKVPLFGEELTLRLCDTRRVTVRDGFVFLPSSAPKAALKKYYVSRLREYLASALSLYAQRMGVTPTGLRVTSARTRWGSCNGENALAFSFYLGMCAPFAVDYVVVHELCHIRHKNHSKAFWNEVAKYFPDYKKAKQYLKEKSSFTELF